RSPARTAASRTCRTVCARSAGSTMASSSRRWTRKPNRSSAPPARPMMKIAVDAMGGDHAPANEVQGAIQAANELGVGVVLVGAERQLHDELRRHGWRGRAIEVVDATEVITMSDPVAQAVRRKRNSSLHVAAKCVSDGRATGLVSAGNTGAVMGVAMIKLGTLKSVDRPALATVLPTVTGRGALMLDVGANAECKPEHLMQFAVMGAIYARE